MKPPPLIYRPPHAPFLPIVHVDAHVVVVDKPAGLLSVPGKGAHLADCVEARAQAIFPEARIVHRLDMDTSGLLILARGARALRILSGQFEKRITRKFYVAEVAGAPGAGAGWIDLPLRADWPNRPRQMVCWEAGKAAETRWRVIARGAERALVGLIPRTGRSHQLRVHLAEIGHPILGDPFYGRVAAPRLALHAARLSWRCPGDGGWRAARAAAPEFVRAYRR